MLEPKWDLVFEVIIYFKEWQNKINFMCYQDLDLAINEFRGFTKCKIEYMKNTSCFDEDAIKLIIFFIDEMTLKILNDNYKKWKLLQVELLKLNTGGQVFFEIVDAMNQKYLTVKDDTNTENENNLLFNLKLSLLLLKLGFRGKFYNSEENYISCINYIKQNIE